MPKIYTNIILYLTKYSDNMLYLRKYTCNIYYTSQNTIPYKIHRQHTMFNKQTSNKLYLTKYAGSILYLKKYKCTIVYYTKSKQWMHCAKHKSTGRILHITKDIFNR